MGKPRYKVGQVLEHRETGKIYVIKSHNTTYFYSFHIRPIEDLNKQYNPNEGLFHMYISYSQIKKDFKCISKSRAKVIEKTVKVLFGKSFL